MSDVSLKDLGRVDWPPTLRLAAARGISSAAVVTLLMVLVGSVRGSATDILGYFSTMAIGLPIGAPLYHLLLRGLASIFSSVGLGLGVTACNLLAGLVALIASLGDPIVYAINKQLPALFGVPELKLFAMSASLLVLRPEAPDV